MSDTSPSDEQRDRCLDELSLAYASGQIDSSQFAERSDQIIMGTTLSDLNDALAGLPVKGISAEQQVPALDEGRDIGSLSPAVVASGSRARTSSPRTHLIVLCGSVLLVVIAIGSILYGAYEAKRPPTTQPSYAVVSPIPVRSFFEFDDSWRYRDFLSGSISSAVVTRDEARLHVKPQGEQWLRATISKDGQITTEPAEPGTGIFDSLEANVSVVSEVVEVTTAAAESPVATIEFRRTDPQAHVQMIVTTDDGRQAVWDAFTRIMLQPPAFSLTPGTIMPTAGGPGSTSTSSPSSTPSRKRPTTSPTR